jgi:hypothetical protein
MGLAIISFFLGFVFLTIGIETLIGIREDRTTPLNGLLPLRGRWLRIAWGVCMLLAAAAIWLGGAEMAWEDLSHIRLR